MLRFQIPPHGLYAGCQRGSAVTGTAVPAYAAEHERDWKGDVKDVCQRRVVRPYPEPKTLKNPASKPRLRKRWNWSTPAEGGEVMVVPRNPPHEMPVVSLMVVLSKAE
ncbi:hypothetical protein MTO96_031433 [Rhipicephalus appendiculatus]